MVLASDIRAGDITNTEKASIFFKISFCPTVAPRLMLTLMHSHVDADIAHSMHFFVLPFVRFV